MILRRILLHSPVRSFINLIIIKSRSFGSKSRYFAYRFFSCKHALTTPFFSWLASTDNLATHDAKGTYLNLLVLILLIKLLFLFFPSRYSSSIAYALYLGFDDGPPCLNKISYFVLLFAFSTLALATHRIS